jgi:CRP-like cAMP-binding protein
MLCVIKNMEQLKDCISKQIRIESKSLDKILSMFETVEIKKGDYFLKSGTVCRKMAFIVNGYLRMFDTVEGKEITLWIGNNGKFITSVSSFVFQTISIWNIQALTDCKLQVITKEKHLQLAETEPKWLEFDNLLLARSFALLEQGAFTQLYTTAQERYNELLKNEPELFLNVPHQYIASMLGIAPESLSRIRKKSIE